MKFIIFCLLALAFAGKLTNEKVTHKLKIGVDVDGKS